MLNLVVKSIEDIEKIPILTKKEIRQNMSEFKGHISAKTGGTTGNPLLLYLDKYSPAREWAHYHKIWEKVGYKYTDAKFSFRDLGSDVKFLKYDFQHNEYHINIWDIHEMTSSHIDEFFKILTIRNVKYFRGYPSAINDFLKEIEKKISRDQKEILQKNIICCFYNSEYPTPQIVYYLKNEWGLDFISGYGHTEMCVLAAAKINELDYYPFHTYGFTEVVDNMLIGTSYHNFDMPLIRYNTDDLVRAKRYANGIIRSFEVKEGRIIDFIFDKKNKKIPLTGLLNKIQHKVFSQIEYIQVFQKEIGFATIIVSQSNGDFIDAPSLLKLDYLDLDWDFIYLRKPIRTISGKVPLRVQKLP